MRPWIKKNDRDGLQTWEFLQISDDDAGHTVEFVSRNLGT